MSMLFCVGELIPHAGKNSIYPQILHINKVNYAYIVDG